MKPFNHTARLAMVGLLAAAMPAAAAPAAPDAQARAAWQDAIGRTPVPAEGCFKASYPNTTWAAVKCTAAPARPYLPRRGAIGRTVGNGNDYAGVVSGILTSSVGSFPTVTGLKSETGYGGAANTYSLQLNSQFFTSVACNGSSDPSSCLGWQQFVYSNEGVAFMQYWLINYGSTCPSGSWMQYEGSCYRNSAAVSVPTQKITQLAHLKITGKAVKSGTDTMTFTTASEAYSTTGKDSVVYLGASWNAAEFNVVGDGGGSNAKFNTGTSITVNIALTDGKTTVPTCEGDDGTTGETNNLTLGKCTATGGAAPSIKFTESN